jgi:putative ABC transport system permease protein
MLLISIFAMVALVLAAVGIYGVMSHMVNERTHEIGIRMALGAVGGDVLGLVMRQTARLVAIGAVLGIAGALALGRFLTSLVFEVRPGDPTTLVTVTVLLTLVAVAATLIPALRATRVMPIVALRRE